VIALNFWDGVALTLSVVALVLSLISLSLTRRN